jgi:hypothetical protein
MKNEFSKSSKYQNDQDNEISFLLFFEIAWKKKFFIFSFTSIAAISSVIYALWLPNMYTSSVLLSPVNENETLSSKLSSYSALAGLAGVSLPNEVSSKSTEAIERIRSFSFFENYFLPNIEVENLIAAEDWDHISNKVLYDKEKFNQSENKWVRKVSYPLKTIPSSQEAYKIYAKKIKIFQDKKTKFVGISTDHFSPYISKKWIDIIVENINESMREEDKKAASSAIDFLNKTSAETNLNPIKEGISKLLETQMQTLMLASANESYIFKVIDPPLVSEKHSGPPRAIICIMTTLFAGLFSLLLSFFNYFRAQRKNIT